MSKLRRVDDALYVHFITFSCYHRRRLLDHDQPKRILLGILTDELAKFEARCVGFVIMPDHVHALGREQRCQVKGVRCQEPFNHFLDDLAINGS